MAEQWEIILKAESGGGGAAATNTAPTSETPAEAQQKSTFKSMGDYAAQMLGVAGPLIFVLNMIRKSKIYSTFMDSFLTVMSAMMDILLIPMIPLLTWVLRFLISFLPEVQKFVRNPQQGIKEAFAGLPDHLRSIGKFLDSVSTTLGATGSTTTVFSRLSDIWSEAIETNKTRFNIMVNNIFDLWKSDKSVWDKLTGTIKEIISGAKDMWPAVSLALSQSWYGVIQPEIVKFWTESLKPALDNLGPIGKELQKAGDTLNSIWGDPDSSFWDKIVKSAGVAWDAASKLLGIAWDTYVSPKLQYIFGDYLPKLANTFFTEYLPRVGGWFFTKALPLAMDNAFTEIMSEAMKGIAQLLVNMNPKSMDWLPGVAGTREFFQNRLDNNYYAPQMQSLPALPDMSDIKWPDMLLGTANTVSGAAQSSNTINNNNNNQKSVNIGSLQYNISQNSQITTRDLSKFTENDFKNAALRIL